LAPPPSPYPTKTIKIAFPRFSYFPLKRSPDLLGGTSKELRVKALSKVFERPFKGLSKAFQLPLWGCPEFPLQGIQGMKGSRDSLGSWVALLKSSPPFKSRAAARALIVPLLCQCSSFARGLTAGSW
jgi:hypothetical protein